MDQISIRYNPTDRDRNHVLVNGQDISQVVTGFALDTNVYDLPEVILRLAVFEVSFEIDGRIVVNQEAVIPESIARQLYEQLQVRFESHKTAYVPSCQEAR